MSICKSIFLVGLCSCILLGCGGGGNVGGPAGGSDLVESSIVVTQIDASIDEVLVGSIIGLEGESTLSASQVASHDWVQVSGIPVTQVSSSRQQEITFKAPDVEEPSPVTVAYTVVSKNGPESTSLITLRIVPEFTSSDGPAPTHPLLDPNDLSFYATFPKDSAGVIMDRQGRGTGYHPGVVARYASLLWQRWLESSDAESLQIALVNADWLVDNLECFNGKGMWRHSWEKPPYSDDPDWGSAMSNGFGAAALTQLARHSDDEARYLEYARCAVNAFAANVTAGGVRTRLETGRDWYEEIATEVRGGQLNGMMFSLGGLYVVWHGARSNTTSKMLVRGLAGLRERLPEYDDGFTSLYDYRIDEVTGQPSRAHGNYNAIHVDQLLWLYHVTGDDMFFDFANRFQNYEPLMIDNVKRVTPAGSVEGGPIELLDDGGKYGGIHQESVPITLRLKFTQSAVITHLMLALPGDLPGLPPFELGIPGDVNSINIVDNQSTEKYDHNFKGSLTTIFLIDVSGFAYDTDELDVKFSQGTHSNAIRLREIGVHYDDDNRLLLDRYDHLRTKKNW